jgi:hypothetical protein
MVLGAMGLLLKTVVAFCVGFALLAGAQRLWMTSIISQVNSQSVAGIGLPQMKPAYSFEKSNFDNLISAMHPKPIDTSAAQRAWMNSLGHEQSLQIRAAQDMQMKFGAGLRR